jgi:hypothetical protein
VSDERLSAEGECMKAIQLELDFRNAHSWCEAFAQALAEPEGADLRMLWRSLQPELMGLSQKEQLSVAGQALCDLAEVCQRRADLMWDEWVDQHNTDGPIPDEDFLAGLVQKSMYLDISGLVKQPKSRRTGSILKNKGESVVTEITKEQALLMTEEEEASLLMEMLEHDEYIVNWNQAIRLWLTQKQTAEVSFTELLEELGQPIIKAWLALLLGGFELSQSGEFYDMSGVLIAHRQNH